MILDATEKILVDLVRKDYIVYAPKSVKQIKRDYKELDDHEEFKPLTSPELMFVWWFACQCSPIIELPEEKRVMIAIEKSFKVRGQMEARKLEYKDLSFPDHIKAAIKRMDRFDPGGRIRALHDDLHLLKQCESVIRKDISMASLEDAAEWFKVVKSAREMRDSIMRKIERGADGVEEKENVMSSALEGVSSDFMKSKLN